MSRRDPVVTEIDVRGHKVYAVRLTEKGSRIEIPRGSKIVNVVIPVGGDRTWAYAEQLARELCEEAYERFFGRRVQQDTVITVTFVTTQVVVELRTSSW